MSGKEPDYLANPLLIQEPGTSQRFCRVRERTVFLGFQNAETKNALPRHWTVRSLAQSTQGGWRICIAVWHLRTKIPQDFRGTLMFWKPTTTFKIVADQLSVISEQNRETWKYGYRF